MGQIDVSVSHAILKDIGNECYRSRQSIIKRVCFPLAQSPVSVRQEFATPIVNALKTRRLSQLMHSPAQCTQRGIYITLAHEGVSSLQGWCYLNIVLEQYLAEQQY